MHGPAHATTAPSAASHALHRPPSQLAICLRGRRLSHLSRYVSEGTPFMRFFCREAVRGELGVRAGLVG